MKILKRAIELLFYCAVFALLLSRSMSAVVSHDENQFVAAAQMLAERGLLPYRDYPYTHMPYAIALYALAVRLSPYGYLAARVLGSVTWLACIIVMAAITRLISRSFPGTEGEHRPFRSMLVEFGLILVFIYAPMSSYVLGAALNHSFATLASLLALLFFLRGLTGTAPARTSAFWSGVFISLAACIRFNFASLAPVLLLLWAASGLVHDQFHPWRTVIACLVGAAVGALPALGTLLLAPTPFYYGNIVYIRLNTLYYQGILFKHDMNLPAKIVTFSRGLLARPFDLAVYILAVAAGLLFIVRFAKRRSGEDLAGAAAAAFAATMLVAAFAPTPTQEHYFFGPVPFLVLLAFCAGWWARRWSSHAPLVLALVLPTVLVITGQVPDPLGQLARLKNPAGWTPMQVHSFAEGLKTEVPRGRILSLMPMITMEAGYEAYPFTATGPFTWRTSLLLTAERRAQYGVVSPEELPGILDAAPPAAILTGFETPNAGFTFQDLGGLEKPFIEYARAHNYRPVPLSPAFVEHPLTLWLPRP